MSAQSSRPKREKSTITVKKSATHDPAVERVAARTEMPMEASIAWRDMGEMWGDMGRYGEMQGRYRGDMGRCPSRRASPGEI